MGAFLLTMVLGDDEEEKNGKSVRKLNFWLFIDIFIFKMMTVLNFATSLFNYWAMSAFRWPCQHFDAGNGRKDIIGTEIKI